LYDFGLCLAASLFHNLTYQVLQGICLASTVVMYRLGITRYHPLYYTIELTLVANRWLQTPLFDDCRGQFAGSKGLIQYFLGLRAINTPFVEQIKQICQGGR